MNYFDSLFVLKNAVLNPELTLRRVTTVCARVAIGNKNNNNTKYAPGAHREESQYKLLIRTLLACHCACNIPCVVCTVCGVQIYNISLSGSRMAIDFLTERAVRSTVKRFVRAQFNIILSVC